jgi:excisionase family DNA binding protein
MSPKEFMTVEEVAKYLVVDPRTVYRYIKAKKIKATKIGSWRILREDLQDFIKRSSNLHNGKRS